MGQGIGSYGSGNGKLWVREYEVMGQGVRVLLLGLKVED